MDIQFSRNQIEFEEFFSTEEKCEQIVAVLKWPDGFVCPRCSGHEVRQKTRGRFVCCSCSHETTLICSTLFSGTRKPLRVWMHALWWITGQKTGVSAVGFQHIMGIGSYETAWTWLHKLRQAMSQSGQNKLNGTVEVDETFVGGEREGKHGRGAAGKVLVVIAAESRGKAIGRIRLAVIPNAETFTLEAFIQIYIERRSTIVTDGWIGYRNVGKLGFRHRVDANEKKALPKVHRVASLLKRWLLGTHQGRINEKHLQAYLNEFVFRFNRRGAKNRGILFGKLLELCVQMPRLTYLNIVTKTYPNERVIAEQI